MSFKDAIKSFFVKFLTFSGRASRSEFWYAMLFCGLVSAGLGGLEELACALNGWSRTAEAPLLATLFDLAITIPSMAVGVRRLHDIGRSGWWYLLLIIAPFGLILIGALSYIDLLFLIALIAAPVPIVILIIWWCKGREPYDTPWGPDPLANPEVEWTP
jgi:uncharacterized membrane protein YhaH (DUF805 family)